MFRLPTLLAVVCVSGTAHADVSITGTVIDNTTKVGLPAATIQVTGGANDQTIASELDGSFTLTLAPGTYTIVVSTAEYLEQSRRITVAEDQAPELHVALDPVPATASETIEIVDKIDTRKES